MSCAAQDDLMQFDRPNTYPLKLGAVRRPVTGRPNETGQFEQVPQPAQRAFWIIALLAALGLHVAIAMAFILQPTPDDEFNGSPIEIDVVAPPAAPKIETPDLPIGPAAPEIAPSTIAPPTAAAAPPEAVVEPKVERTDRDDAELTAREVPPEKPTPDQKPREETPPVDVQANAAPPSDAMAPPKLRLPPDERASAPLSIGESPVDQQVKMTWMKSLAAHLGRNKRYPTGRKGDRGTFEVLVRFEIDETGHVLSSQILHGSGDASFDAAALAMIARASPVPAPPHDLWVHDPLIDIPVTFHAKN